jgi:hypothetical protein
VLVAPKLQEKRVDLRRIPYEKESMLHPQRLFAALLGFVLFGVLALAAEAGNAPDSRLDAASSEVAGKPVTVHCETSQTEWVVLIARFGVRAPAGGFAIIGQSTNYLAPPYCLTLRQLLRSGSPADWSGLPGWALLALLHEAVHQRGILDEGITDCMALALVRRYAISLLGMPERVAETRVVYRRKRVKVKGRWVWRRVAVRVRVLVANPELARVVAQAEQAHVTSEPPYNRDCTGITP